MPRPEAGAIPRTPDARPGPRPASGSRRSPPSVRGCVPAGRHEPVRSSASRTEDLPLDCRGSRGPARPPAEPPGSPAPRDASPAVSGGVPPLRGLLSRKTGKRLTGEAVHRPVGIRPRPQALVKPDRVPVPVENRPLQPAAPARDRQRGQMREQRAADPQASLLRKHEKIFEIDSRPPEKGREVVEEQGKTDGLAVLFREDHLCEGTLAEQPGREQTFS